MAIEHSLEEYKIAIRAERALVSKIAERLGVTYQAVWKRIKETPELQAAIQEEESRQIDLSECVIMDKRYSADEKIALTASEKHLRAKAKSRGWVDHTLIGGAEGSPAIILNMIPAKTLNGEKKEKKEEAPETNDE